MENSIDFSFCSAHLEIDEYIVWKGRPQRGHYFKKEDIRIIPVAFVAILTIFLYFCYEKLFWDLPFLYFYGRVAAVLLFLFLAMRFIVVPFLRKRSLYVITNKKVIVKIWRKVKFMDLADPLPIYTVFYRDGNGTISFGQRGILPVWQNGNVSSTRPSFIYLRGVVELTNISHAKKVYDLICNVIYNLNIRENASDEKADLF